MLEGKVVNSKQSLLVACEAGAGNILSSWLKLQTDPDHFTLCLDGPSVRIFALAHPDTKKISLQDFERQPRQFNRVITGSSWMPDLERSAIRIAKEAGIPSVGIVDHWVNYKERFLPISLWQNPPADWQSYLPDTIWLFDSYAMKIALEIGYPRERLVQWENPYLEETRRNIAFHAEKNPPTSEEIRLLYICEPVADDVEKTYGDPRHWGFDEYELMDNLLADLEAQRDSGLRVVARLRLHPNEARGKYDSWIEKSDLLQASNSTDLAQDIAWADCIVGIESMAMVASLYSGKPVFSVLPPESKKAYFLPFPEIKRCSRPAEAIQAFQELRKTSR